MTDHDDLKTEERRFDALLSAMLSREPLPVSALRPTAGQTSGGGTSEGSQRNSAGKFTPRARERDPDHLSIAEVLIAYAREHAPHVRSRDTIAYAIQALEPWWGGGWAPGHVAGNPAAGVRPLPPRFSTPRG